MPFLFIGSTGDHAGHSLLTWTLANRLRDKGLRVGFLKPFGSHPTRMKDISTDHDAFLFKEILNLRAPYEEICPYVVSDDGWKEKAAEALLKEIKGRALDIEKGHDVLLIMGSRQIFFDDAPFPVPEISLISELKADAVLIHRYRTAAKSVYSLLSLVSLLKDRVKGILLNRIPPEKTGEVRDRIIPSLVQRGVPITAVVGEDPLLSFKSIREILDVLKGDILCGEDKLEVPVGGMTVGSVDLQGELRVFKRTYNKIILLRPIPFEKASEEPAAPRPVAGILITGGRHPAKPLLQAARHASLPLLRVDADSFTILERLEHATFSLSPKDDAKVHRFTETLDRDGALDRLLNSLKLSC